MTLHDGELVMSYADLVKGVSPRRAEAGGGSVSGSRRPSGAAEGGGDRPPLVIMANNSSKPPTPGALRVAADRVQTLIREICGDLAEAKRIVKCGRCPTGKGNTAVKRTDNNQAYAAGVQTCGSVWACAQCSFKIRAKRAIEITQAVRVHLERGGSVLHVVFTVAHRPDEALTDIWGVLSDTWSYLTSGGSWSNFKNALGLDGYIRSAEVTHGGNGWHPHLHVLLFINKPVSPLENEDDYYQLRHYLRKRWTKRLTEKHGREVSQEFGLRIDPVKADNAEGSGQYLTKVGLEMAMTNTKLGRGEGQRTPFAIAHDAAETGDIEDMNLWREWVQGSHNKRSITWSQGLREHLGLGPEKTDEELATEDPDGQTVAEITPDLWRAITARRDGTRVHVLAAFEHHQDAIDGARAVARLLAGLHIHVEIRQTARTELPLLDLAPPQTTTNDRSNTKC